MVTRRSELAAQILGGKYGPEEDREHEAKKELHQLCDLDGG
jgi:hypothetical protein